MSIDIKYRASFFSQLHKAIEQNTELTLGEVMYSAFHKDNLKGKHFWHATDEEMVTALENFNKFGIEDEEPLNEQEFDFWLSQKEIIK